VKAFESIAGRAIAKGFAEADVLRWIGSQPSGPCFYRTRRGRMAQIYWQVNADDKRDFL